MLTRPLTISVAVNYAPDTEMLEYLCGENERDTGHLVGSAAKGIKLSPATLDKYVGIMTFAKGLRAPNRFFQGNQPSRSRMASCTTTTFL